MYHLIFILLGRILFQNPRITLLLSLYIARKIAYWDTLTMNLIDHYIYDASFISQIFYLSLMRDLWHEIESAFKKVLKKENARTRGIDDLEITESRDTIHIHILWKARDQKYKSDGVIDSNSKK